MNRTVVAPEPGTETNRAAPPMRTVGRISGIPAIGEAPWGTHFCQFYHSKQDLLDILVPYFRSGLEDNEACVWVTCEPVTTEDAVAAMNESMPEFGRRLADGQMAIVPHTDWYIPDGRFRAERVLQGWAKRLEDALASGYAGLRATGNLYWLDDSNWRDFADYEGVLESSIGDQRILVVCTYSLDKCGASGMIDVLENHQFALVKRRDWTLIEPSERKRATEAVERMNRALAERTEQLESALTDLRGFSRWVSHDLRAPLRAISGFGQKLTCSAKERLDEDERRMLGRITANAGRMDSLITDILAYSMAQRKSLQTGRLDMESLAHEVSENQSDAFADGEVELRIRPLAGAYGDATMVSQVLANLVGNALKFTRGRPEPRIEIGSREMGGEVVYYVRDNGIGFDVEYAGKVFGAFERLQSGKEYEGSGLGLAIVKQIITRHGGRVWADGSPGIGATFYFTLPRPGAKTQLSAVP